ncbi:MAG: hypothetical protein KF851_06180 [Pirellulaceae bacterium]|nr:hypothetical protein [Pirellulaceae bacterium]
MSTERNKFLARCDWRDTLREADLDRSVSELVEQVVVATRLSRNEKQQVASELIAHFQDGLERGIAPDTLIGEFGEPQLAATLIRRGKIRNRTMANKFWQFGAYGGLGVLAAYVFMSWYFYRGMPQPTLDYMAQINQVFADVPEDQRAWPVYRDVMRKMQFIEGPGGRFEEIYFRDLEKPDDLRLVEATDGEQWQRAIDKLADSKELLDALRLGGQLPILGLELKSNPFDYSPEDQQTLFPNGIPSDGFYGDLKQEFSPRAAKLVDGSFGLMLLPHTQTMRNCARILTADTRWAVETKDWERAVQNVEAMFGLARQAAEPGFYIGNLVACAISELTCDTLYEVVGAGAEQLSDNHLERLQRAAERDSMWDLVKFETERALFDDILQRTFTDNGNGDGRITAAGLEFLTKSKELGAISPEANQYLQSSWGSMYLRVLGPTALIWMPNRREFTAAADDFYTMLEQRFFSPYHLDRMDEVETSEGFQYQILSRLLPFVKQFRGSIARAEVNRQSVAAAVAIYRFHRQHNRWPNSADEVVGKYLNSFPIDPLNGQPLVYLPKSDGFVLYGFGIDGDDDGGRPYLVSKETGQPAPELDEKDLRPHHANEFHFRIAQETDGDWIAWPRK